MKNGTGADICSQKFDTGSGSCGFNSYCEPDAEGKSICQCPPHYSFKDPVRKYEGCKPDFSAQICEPGGEASFNFTLLENVDWPSNDAEQLSPMNETECRENCLKDCLCLAAIYHSGTDNGTCWKKKSPLATGSSGSDVGRKAFIKFSALSNSSSRPPPDSITGNAHWKTWAIVASSVLCGFVVLNIGLISAFCFVCRRSPRPLHPNYGSITGPTLRSFTYEELEEATKGFSEEVGRGAFGTVYKGALSSQPEIQIAVKKLQLEENPLEEAEKEFMNEVTTIGQTHHRNLVQLLGFCKEGAHRLMVFEFMSKGSLNKFVFGSDRPDWNQRVQIALGIAGGLAYLHEECRTQIIHCDIKPQNILLDDNLEARIADFGLAKLLRLDQTRTSTGIRGTIGYFAPEWFKNVAITTKVDVYSFGVMLLEIICCRRNFDWGVESQARVTVIDKAKQCYRNGRLDLLVEDDEEAKGDGARLERFVMVGISCIQDEPWLRPSMKMVAQMLEGVSPVSLLPNMYSISS